jgi:hypothetical protein
MNGRVVDARPDRFKRPTRGRCRSPSGTASPKWRGPMRDRDWRPRVPAHSRRTAAGCCAALWPGAAIVVRYPRFPGSASSIFPRTPSTARNPGTGATPMARPGGSTAFQPLAQVAHFAHGNDSDGVRIPAASKPVRRSSQAPVPQGHRRRCLARQQAGNGPLTRKRQWQMPLHYSRYGGTSGLACLRLGQAIRSRLRSVLLAAGGLPARLPRRQWLAFTSRALRAAGPSSPGDIFPYDQLVPLLSPLVRQHRDKAAAASCAAEAVRVPHGGPAAARGAGGRISGQAALGLITRGFFADWPLLLAPPAHSQVPLAGNPNGWGLTSNQTYQKACGAAHVNLEPLLSCGPASAPPGWRCGPRGALAVPQIVAEPPADGGGRRSSSRLYRAPSQATPVARVAGFADKESRLNLPADRARTIPDVVSPCRYLGGRG